MTRRRRRCSNISRRCNGISPGAQGGGPLTGLVAAAVVAASSEAQHPALLRQPVQLAFNPLLLNSAYRSLPGTFAVSLPALACAHDNRVFRGFGRRQLIDLICAPRALPWSPAALLDRATSRPVLPLDQLRQAAQAVGKTLVFFRRLGKWCIFSGTRPTRTDRRAVGHRGPWAGRDTTELVLERINQRSVNLSDRMGGKAECVGGGVPVPLTITP
jgi:hypothetical protein